MSEDAVTTMPELIVSVIIFSAFLALTPAVIACTAVWWSRWSLFRLDRALGEGALDRRFVYYIVPLILVSIGILFAVVAEVAAGAGDISTVLWLLIVAWCIQITGLTASSRPAHRRLQNHRKWMRAIESRDLSRLDLPTVIDTTKQLARLQSTGKRFRARAHSLTLTRFLANRPRRSLIIAAVTLFSLANFVFAVVDGALTETLGSTAAGGSLPDLDDLAVLVSPWLGPIYLVQRWHIDYFFIAQSGRDLARQATQMHRRYRDALKLRQQAHPHLTS